MAVLAVKSEGLSPRLRGNRWCRYCQPRPAGSIPAPAGEPLRKRLHIEHMEVYPRACGGTIEVGHAIPLPSGLSPRLRGNPPQGSGQSSVRRSIPAPAGEPPAETTTLTQTPVYPRACGGTHLTSYDQKIAYGLSPRLRGNRVHVGVGVGASGSIPAPAGEPLSITTKLDSGRVYPRACGGTVVSVLGAFPVGGLSPRLRGNRIYNTGSGDLIGSIPAPAGEPLPTRTLVIAPRVYPRACGGTFSLSGPFSHPRGLSPRLRGNLYEWCLRHQS